MPPGRHTAIRLDLSAGERSALTRVLRAWDTTATVAKHARVILLISEGMPVSHAAKTVGLSRNKVYDWIARYQAHGLPGLKDQRRYNAGNGGAHGGGRPRKFRYAPGTWVHWTCAPAKPWYVHWQRYTLRPGLPALIEYGVGLEGQTTAGLFWALEADVSTASSSRQLVAGVSPANRRSG